jgi:transcriptional regulator with XRE-family HTH domain
MSTIVNSLDETLAQRLKQERQARGWSMADLAARSGVSKAMIAKIESGAASPTAALLGKLSGAFGLSLSTLLARAEGAAARLIRRDQQQTWTDAESRYERRAVSPPGARGAEIVEVTLPPDARVAFPASSYAFLRHQILVLSGALRFTEGTTIHDLGEGDLLELGEPTGCAYENPDDRACRYLVILTRI